MPNKIAPCKGCMDRFSSCHSMCKLYIEWKALKDKKRQESFEVNQTDYEVRGIQIDGQNKAFKKKRRNKW